MIKNGVTRSEFITFSEELIDENTFFPKPSEILAKVKQRRQKIAERREANIRYVQGIEWKNNHPELLTARDKAELEEHKAGRQNAIEKRGGGFSRIGEI